MLCDMAGSGAGQRGAAQGSQGSRRPQINWVPWEKGHHCNMPSAYSPSRQFLPVFTIVLTAAVALFGFANSIWPAPESFDNIE